MAQRAVEAEPGTWQTELGEALTGAHVEQNPRVLAAARALLAAADLAGTAAAVAGPRPVRPRVALARNRDGT